ncbi:long-chain-acyl-CoA synthetase [Cupriavidus necator]|uniref:Long-chain-acyl-CoA synthetase n=2 Tax=Cupriavidus necator TaxID=106590 RepID=A0A1U9V012_CUPNE|nr:long-chain-acyl-CoA synthetase [Cupriavidus necator]
MNHNVIRMQDVRAAQAWPSREETQRKLDRRSAIAQRHRSDDSRGVAERFEQSVRDFAGRVCLRYGDATFTYAELNALANRVAHAAHAQGVRCGDTVAICMENRPAFFVLHLGFAKIGATVSFLNTNLPGKPLRHALQTTGARLVVVGEECLASFDNPECRGVVPCWLWPDDERPASEALRALCALDLAALAGAAPEHDPPASWRAGLVAGQTAVHIFTSGTTGLPKAAVISHLRWLVTGDVMQATMDVRPDDVFYCFLPLYHGAAALSAGATAFAAGASLVLRRKFSKREFWNDVRRCGITICQYVGEICRYLLSEAPRADDRTHTLRALVGAGMSTETWDAFVRRFGKLDIYEGWGATEANVNTINVDNRVGSCGRVPFWHKTSLRIVRYDVETDSHPRDADGFMIPCAPGEVGEALGMIGDGNGNLISRFDGYTSAEATERKILRNVLCPGDSWWSSGDLLRYDEDGYCYFVDRIGDTFRWKSENVSTMEVADSLGDLPGLESITVYGVQVPGMEGRAGMAALVMQPGRAFDPGAFYALTCQRVPRYAAPLFVRIADTADLTSTFKLRKVDLQREGYDPALVRDPLYVRDERAGTYVPFAPAAVQRALGA